MKVKEIKELMKHFEEPKYDDYEMVFWDYARQKRMDGHFGGLSHPDKEISIPISVVGEKTWVNPHNVTQLPESIPSPFEEGETATLKKTKDVMSGIEYDRYAYVCNKTGYIFGTQVSETFTMCSYYCNAQKKFRDKLEANGINPWD